MDAANLFAPGEVAKTLATLFAPGEVFEVRLLKAKAPSHYGQKTVSGWFDDPAKAVEALGTITEWSGAYITLNTVNSALLARANNRLKEAESTTSDTDIVARKWLLLDFDAERPTGISATSDELESAKNVALETTGWLSMEQGWPEPVLAMSGNGWHALYRINLPSDDGGLVAKVLKALAQLHNRQAVKVDTAVGNAGRVSWYPCPRSW